MTTPSGLTPDGSVPGDISFGDYANKTQADWESDQQAQWEDAAAGVLVPFGSFIQNLPLTVVVAMLHMLGDLLDMVPIVGSTLEEIVDNIADGLNSSISTAQTTADTAHETATTALGNYATLEDEYLSSGTVIGNHENRITTLESGATIAEYFSNDIWAKPTVPEVGGAYATHEFVGVAGGGGGRRPQSISSGDRIGGRPGGQGGYGSTGPVANGSVMASVNVYIGTGGTGGTSNATNGTAGTATYFTDTAGTIISMGGGPAGDSSTSAQVAGSGTFPEWNASGGFGAKTSGAIPINAEAGNSGYLAPGGYSGLGFQDARIGGDGGNCPAGRIGPGGGGGGGGLMKAGGNGGFPGGGAGGGGGSGSGPSDPTGNGGNGAPGRGVIISRV